MVMFLQHLQQLVQYVRDRPPQLCIDWKAGGTGAPNQGSGYASMSPLSDMLWNFPIVVSHLVEWRWYKFTWNELPRGHGNRAK
ncbi:hypothetical protein MTR67_048795 [Solanum verrucosum]|uniref:Uncharacterized protein n=1 Tax=Solanum verrucosum TaxID=315347 RepID=A0AAF0V086_SOLVR|nr:hypothetical protein MTR67_048795 [Solanum verrucosum]